MKISSFRNTATYRKLWAGVPSTSPLYHGGGMNLRVRPRVKKVLWISNKLQLLVKHEQIWGGCEGGYKEAKKSDKEVSDIKSQTPHPLINTFFSVIRILCPHCTASFCATKNIIPDRASIHTQERLWQREFREGAKLRHADLESEASHIG